MRELRLDAARERRHGLQIMTFEQLAARLAGGLTQPVDDETLRAAIQATLPETALGELDAIKDFPGMVGAAVDTLRKAWRAGIDIQTRAGDHPRLRSIAALEAAVVEALPPAMMRPGDLVDAALRRIDHAEALLGPVDIVGITELSPCWRPLLHAMATRIPVRWIAGPRPTPHWLNGGAVEIVREAPQTPEVAVISASTPYHEAIEALRWARELVCSGVAGPADIAITAVSPGDYDDHFLPLRADANLDLHFVHGTKVTAHREGQAAAALADILMRGLSQSRIRRLSALLGAYPGPFQALPEGWMRVLPTEAPLTSAEAWTRLLERLSPADWPDGRDHGRTLCEIITLLNGGLQAAEEIGEALLHGTRASDLAKSAARRTRRLPRSLPGSAQARRRLRSLPLDSVAAGERARRLATALRAPARPQLLALAARTRGGPPALRSHRSHRGARSAAGRAADRRDFETILATTSCQVTLSRARRDSDGRLLGRSALLQGRPPETYLRRNAVPAHAFSETDRLTARPQEFRTLPQALGAERCWRNWWRAELTPHDGLVRADHPVLRAILERTQSASSLRQLLRNPLGFVWRYGLGWRAPESRDDPLVLDALDLGDLVHQILDRDTSAARSARRPLEGHRGADSCRGRNRRRRGGTALGE